MKKILIACLATLGVVGTAAAGDVAKGKAAAAVCAACHGPDGNSAAPNFPKIAGQGAKYIAKQLADMKSGVRSVPEMAGFVANMSEETMADLGAFYESQTVKGGAADKELVALGEKIFRAGNQETGVPACGACHGPAGKGMGLASFPALAGQHAAYTEKQLKDFQAGKRVNDGDSKMMRDIADRMKEREIKAVASYIQGLR